MNNPDPVLIYGAGGLGRELLTYLKNNDQTPVGFVDKRSAEINSIDGITVHSLDDAQDHFAESKVRVVIAIHNFQVSVANITSELQQTGFTLVQTLWQFCQSEKWLPNEPYWLAPHLDWRSAQTKITDAYNLLSDDRSRELYSQLIRLRTHGDYQGLDLPDAESQYDVADLPDYIQPIRLIDCGAFDGDTIQRLLTKGNKIEDVRAFEPDDDNFAKLKRYLDSIGLGTAINAGTFDRKGEIRFSGTGSGSSHIDHEGDNVISTVKIDEACQGFVPTLIKMDVEGAEAASILGALNTITGCRPALAISIYHKPEDLWELILMISQLGLDYQIYLRVHGHNGFDTVMYAFPK